MDPGAVNLPPGFQLEGGPQLPPGFQLEGGQPAPKPNAFSAALQNPMNALPGALPGHFLMKGMEAVNNAVEHGAYNLGGRVTDSLASGDRSFLNPIGAKVPPEVAGGAGYLANVGTQALPVVAGTVLSPQSVAPKLQSMAERIMQAALKPTGKEMDAGRGGAAIQTALQRGFNSSSGEAENLRGMVGGLETQIQNALKTSGNTVDKGEVASRLQDVISRIEKTSLNPQERTAAVEKIYNEVLANPKLPNQIPVGQANEIKQGIYQMLRDKYGEIGSDAVEAQKALARGLKETIGKAEPGVASKLKEQSELANLLRIMQRRANVEGNSNIASLAPLAAHPPAAIGFLADKYGMSKSMLARMLYQNQNTIPTAAGATTGALLSNQLRTPPE